ncbi:MAG: hypothetical protein KatS3mg005_0329 [Bryobacteraceae bacterium]|nr:MAG: hypothetical protein KatS3mg005_0329 [Bryobacteraceae bacterium]
MLYEKTSQKSMAEIELALRDSAARHKFGVIHVHDLQKTMKEKGVDFGGECAIFEVCNPHQAKRALEAEPAISTVLPCRISVYQRGEQRVIATFLPTAMMQLFDSAGLRPVAEEVETVVKAMIDESA